MNITPHVTLDNLVYHPTAARLKISNVPPDELLPNLMRLCDVLEPIWDLLNGKMAFLSGYRSHQLQAALVRQGGESTHTDGRGVDFQTPGMDISQAYDLIAGSDIPFDTLTWANNRLGSNWIEVTIPKAGESPRRLCKRNERQHNRMYLA